MGGPTVPPHDESAVATVATVATPCARGTTALVSAIGGSRLKGDEEHCDEAD